MQRIPKIKWYQDYENIFINIDHRNIENEEINFTPNTLSIKFNSESIEYNHTYELLEKINIDNCFFDKTDRSIDITLNKEGDENNYWNFLVKNNKNYKNLIFIDWSNWKDEDDDEINDESTASINNSIEQLQQMPGGMDILNNLDKFKENINHEDVDEEDEVVPDNVIESDENNNETNNSQDEVESINI